jgi:hypothetical protein
VTQVPFCQPSIPQPLDEELTMTQTTQSPLRSLLDSLREALFPEPAPRRAAEAGDKDDGDDDRRLSRDESFYWGFCMNGHW